MARENFYTNLPEFSDFRGITDPANYRDAPDDWWLIFTDVIDSTEAIRLGHYRNINLISAASIVCVQRVLRGQDFPFSFGGDGATMLIPAEFRNDALAALFGLQMRAQTAYGFNLRAGAVSIGELRKDGHPVRVARHALGTHQHVAILEGSGLQEAERRVRESPAQYRYDVQPDPNPDVSGLSCRWHAIPSRRGTVMSLIVQRCVERPELYRDFLDSLEQLLPLGVEAANPVDARDMTYRSVRECIQSERALFRNRPIAWVGRLLEIVLAVGIFRYGFPGLLFSGRAYQDQLRTHSDYRKYDSTLRMTLDCSKEEVHAIRSLCQSYREAGEIRYGIFESDSALMTCFLNGLGAGEHFHFVDGGEGGYTMAAVQLKAQIREDTAATHHP